MKQYLRILVAIFCCFLLPVTPVSAADRVQPTKETVVIVIDPGHGGEQEGTTENGFLEKEMNLITATAMYEELLLYDNVEVYLTRTDDTKLSLKERAAFASSVHADFLFSIHYNASGNHTLFGSEVWISSKVPYNAYGYQFGYCQMLEMQEMGLYLRGIKTKLNEKGTADYYGIIRESASLSIPAVIIEHCHVDEERDVPFCDTREDWIAFGKADARAVAGYFGLSQSSQDLDTGAFDLPAVEPTQVVAATIRDVTHPDSCTLTLLSADYDTGEVTVAITAAEDDGMLLYYDYSVDGGNSFSALQPWPNANVLTGYYPDSFSVTLPIVSGATPEILVRAYNLADLYTTSNAITFTEPFASVKEVPKEETSLIEESSEVPTTVPQEELLSVSASAAVSDTRLDRILFLLELCLAIVAVLFVFVMLLQLRRERRRKARTQRRKEEGDSRSQQL